MTVQIITGDCREVLAGLPEASVQCCVSSPPYFGLRDYGVDGQIGIEPTPDAYVAELVAVFREVRRVLRDDGTLWLNLGDSYSSGGRSSRDVNSANKGNVGAAQSYRPDGCVKPKDLIGIPWMVAFALRADDWYLRQDIIWHKKNPMPESVEDRCTKAHEYVFLLSKGPRYFYDADAIAEAATGQASGNKRGYAVAGQRDGDNANLGGSLHKIGPREMRNRRSVWSINTKPFPEAHFATMPPELAEDCIKAGSRQGDTILDPFGGAGTTGLAADRLQRHAVLIELNPGYAEMARQRINGEAPLFAAAAE